MVTALIKALCDELRNIAKGMSKEAPKAHQNSVRDVPKPSKIRAWDAPGNQNAALKLPGTAKSAQEVPKRRPRSTQERLGAAQERTKAGQVTLKRAPNPSRIQAKTRLEHHLRRKLCSTGSWNDFASFCGWSTKLAMCKNQTKT